MNTIRFLVLVCLVVETSASLNPFSKSGNDYDLEGLEKWLNKQSATKNDTNADIALIKGNLSAFKSSKVDRTAKLLMDIVESEACNQQVLVKVSELAKTEAFYGGNKRTEKLLLKPLLSLHDKCSQFVDETVGGLSENSLDQQQREFVKLLEDNDMLHAVKKYASSRLVPQFHQASRMLPTLWSKFFTHLASKDPRAQVLERKQNGQTNGYEYTLHRDAFDYAMKRYLVEPCQSLTATLKDKFDFEALHGVTRLNSAGGVYTGPKSFDNFLSKRPKPVKNLTFEYLFCADLTRPGRKFDDIFEIVKKY